MRAPSRQTPCGAEDGVLDRRRCEAEGQIDRRGGHPVRQGPGTHWCSRMRGADWALTWVAESKSTTGTKWACGAGGATT